MGYSTPKKPFDLTEFLSKKGTPRPARWRSRAAAPRVAEEPEAQPASAEEIIKDS